MKKSFSILIGGAALIGMAALTSCSNSNENTYEGNKLFCEVISASSLASESVIDANGGMITNYMSYEEKKELDFDVKDLIDKTNSIIDSTPKYNKLESDNSDYQNKIEITVINDTYTIYYNEVVKKEYEEFSDGSKRKYKNGTLIKEVNKGNLDLDLELPEETEVKTYYTGMVVDSMDLTFEFTGVDKYETEEDEIEKKTELVMFINENSYIEIKNKYEAEEDEIEEKFTYKKVEDGETTFEYKISREVEDDEAEIKVEMPDYSINMQYYEENGNKYLKLKYQDEEYKFQIINDGENEGYILL